MKICMLLVALSLVVSVVSAQTIFQSDDGILVPTAAIAPRGSVVISASTVGENLYSDNNTEYFGASVGLKNAEISALANLDDLNWDSVSYGIKYQIGNPAVADDNVGAVLFWQNSEGNTGSPGLALTWFGNDEYRGSISVATMYDDGFLGGVQANYRLLPKLKIFGERMAHQGWGYGVGVGIGRVDLTVERLELTDSWMARIGTEF